LDIETLELLEELLLQYEGTLLLVSHDRAFINHVVTSTLVFEEEGHVGQYAGGYDDWLDQRRSSTPNPSVGKESPSKKRSRKLSNRERDELASLPEKIEQLEAELEQVHQQINDPSFYRNPPDQITALQQRATALPAELERAYNRWQELDES
jgi:ATP-binding cassette subfamily F protein uup